jgi:hypothetical protein
MATIDIALPDELTQALIPPVCINLPPPSMPTVTLPIGGSLHGVADFTRGIPTDCSMNFSLMLQLAPMMASMECLLRVLKFISTAMGAIEDIVKDPIKGLVAAVPKILKAAEDLAPCIAMAAPPFIPTLCFLKDLLGLIARMLLCAVDALENVLNVLSGLEIQIALAQAAGNNDLVIALQCAQQNATTSAEGTMQSLQPIMVLLTLAGTFMQLAGQPSLDVTIPSAIPASDLQAMQTLLQDLGTVATVIKEIADALPPC